MPSPHLQTPGEAGLWAAEPECQEIGGLGLEESGSLRKGAVEDWGEGGEGGGEGLGMLGTGDIEMAEWSGRLA